MTTNQFRVIELALVPRAPKLPADIEGLLAVATLSFCPVKSVARRATADHLAVLIDETLVEAGR